MCLFKNRIHLHYINLFHTSLIEGNASGSPAPEAEASGSQDNQGKEGPS